MKILPFAALCVALLSGCATAPRTEDCCSAPKEVVYVDKPAAECTRSIRDVTQVSPCQVCARFQVSMRADSACAR